MNIKDKNSSSAVKHFLEELTINRIFDLFSPEKISFLILKGPHLAHTVYDDPSQRDSLDLDILVKPSEFSRACAILVQGKFNPAVMLPRRAQSQKEFYNYSFASPYGVVVELHRDLSGYRRYPVEIDGLFERCESFHLGDMQVKGLGTEDLLCHLVIHIAKSCFRYIEPKHVKDIALVTRKRAVDWDRFIARCRQAGCTCAAWYALHAATCMQAAAVVPEEVLAGLTPSPLRRRWLDHHLNPSSYPIYRYPSHTVFQSRVRLTLPLLDRCSSWLPLLGRYARVRFLDLVLSLFPRKKLHVIHLPE